MFFYILGLVGCQGFDGSHDFQLHLPGDAQSRPWCLTWSLSSVDATRAGVLYVLDVLMNKNHVNTTSDFPPNKDGTYENISKRTDQNHDFSSSVFFWCLILGRGGGIPKPLVLCYPQKNQPAGWHLTIISPARGLLDTGSQPCHAHFLLPWLVTETVQHPFLKHAWKNTNLEIKQQMALILLNVIFLCYFHH